MRARNAGSRDIVINHLSDKSTSIRRSKKIFSTQANDCVVAVARGYRWLSWFVYVHLCALVVGYWWGCGGGCAIVVGCHIMFIVQIFLPRSRFYAPVVDRLPGRFPWVWLTIDDGPSEDTLALLDLLDRYQARATFFLIASQALERPDVVRAIVARGHTIGNHTYSHPRAWFWTLGPRKMARQIGDAQEVLSQLTGTAPRWFRSVAGMTNPCVARSLQQHQLTRVAWSVRGFDGVRCDPERAIARLKANITPSAIILVHEGGVAGQSMRVIEGVLKHLKCLDYATIIPKSL